MREMLSCSKRQQLNVYVNWCVLYVDVKPSNILLDTYGNVKMCDFGISGQLIDSVAKTRDAGCRPYMAVCFSSLLDVSIKQLRCVIMSCVCNCLVVMILITSSLLFSAHHRKTISKGIFWEFNFIIQWP